jgi:predicted nucleic acid-binding protein
MTKPEDVKSTAEPEVEWDQMGIAGRAMCFDASALVKRYLDEPGYEKVRAAFRAEPTKYTTPFCFYEALSVLKARIGTGADRARYLHACADLTAWFGAVQRSVKDLDFTDHTTFRHAKQIVEKYGLDFSDAFQIVSVQRGFFSVLAGDSATILATADAKLAKAARSEGLLVWPVLDEDRP